MDSIRTKKSNKKPWIIGGSVVVGLIILIIVLCVSLSSTAEQETGVTVKTVPEAMKFVEDAISKTFEKYESVKKPLVKDIKILNKRLTFVLDLYKTKTDAEKNGQSYDIKIIEEKLTTADFVESEATGDIIKVEHGAKAPGKDGESKDGPSEEDDKTHTDSPPTGSGPSDGDLSPPVEKLHGEKPPTGPATVDGKGTANLQGP